MLSERNARMIADPPAWTPMAPSPDEAELSGLGITRLTTERFQVGPYFYTNRADAIAQAKRSRVAGNDQ
jgi:hypothetical protein